MKRLQVTIDPGDVAVHPIYELFAGGAEYLERAEMINWNVAEEPVVVLDRIVGDGEAFAADLEAMAIVEEFELVPVGDREYYVYVRDAGTRAAWELFEAFEQRNLLTVPPIVYNDDGTATLTLVGPRAGLQAVVEGLPDWLDVEIDAVGGRDARGVDPRDRLSERQREALAAGLAVGYYDVPRTGSHEDVAEAMDCAPSTAAEHLRKAEAGLVRAVLEL